MKQTSTRLKRESKLTHQHRKPINSKPKRVQSAKRSIATTTARHNRNIPKSTTAGHDDITSLLTATQHRIFSTTTSAQPQFQDQTTTTSQPLPSPQPRRKVQVYKCLDPQVPYALGYKWMQELLERKTNKENPEPRDILFIVQHQPVYTLGKRASLENFKFDPAQLLATGQDGTTWGGNSSGAHGTENNNNDDNFAFDLQRVGRGGEVTYHGPGQLTVYPILNLNNFKKDLHWYVEQLESTVLHSLYKYGISDAGIDPENPGVWIGDSKVSAIGAQFKKWNTMHGFSLNVSPIVHQGFNRIVPCGINGREVISIEEIVFKQLRDGDMSGTGLEQQQQRQIEAGVAEVAATTTAQMDQIVNTSGLEMALVDHVFPQPVQLQLPKRFQQLPKPHRIDFNSIGGVKTGLDIDFVADQIIDSFSHVFDVDVVTNDYSVIDFYDISLDNELARPRVWLREIDQAMD